MEPFVPAPPAALYTPDTLFDGFQVDEPGSWTSTLDGRAYQAYVRAGRREAPREVAAAQAAHDAAITADLAANLHGLRPVAIMGGHGVPRGDDAYVGVARIARALTENGFAVLSGGGPGAMEATHLGARFAGHGDIELGQAIDHLAAAATREFPIKQESDLISPTGEFNQKSVQALHTWQVPAFEIAAQTQGHTTGGIGIPTWLYGQEPPTPLASRHAKYFANSIREDGLLAVATYGVIYTPGSAGTLQEIYQDAAQNYYKSMGNIFSPMIFLDTDGIWTAGFAVDTALQRLFKSDDYQTMVAFVTTVEDVVGAIKLRSELMPSNWS